ncbi:MAG TPA: OmpA family protein [Methylibium sp.]
MAHSALAAAAAALACGAHAQSADPYNPSAYLLPNISAIKPDGNWPAHNTGFGGGIKFGQPLSPSWDLQAGVNYARSKENGLSYSQTLLGVDALYLFNPSGWRPFLLGGLGAERDSADLVGGGSRSATRPYVNLGAGLQYRWSPTLGFQADVREVYGFLNNNDFGFKRSSNTYFNLGLIWAFGGAPAAAAPMAAAVAAPPPPPPPAAKAPPPPPPPPPPPKMQKFTLQASELFGFGSAKLSGNQPKLDEVASTLNANPGISKVVIAGYTDRLGTKAGNQKLSQQRAESVRSYLIGKGVAGGRLEAVGKGDADPVAGCKDVKKHAELVKCLEPNRRVEIEPVSYERAVK